MLQASLNAQVVKNDLKNFFWVAYDRIPIAIELASESDN